MTGKKKYLLGILSGALLAISYPPMPFFPLAFIAFVPLFFAIDNSKGHPYLMIYLTFFIYCVGANWWVGSWQKDTDSFLYIAGVALAIGHPLLYLIPFIVYNYLRRCLSRDHAVWLFPFIWVAFEWVQSFGDLSFPWLTIGHTQIYNFYWVQTADIAGVWGLSFFIAFSNSLIFRIIIKYREYKVTGLSIFQIPSMKKYFIWLLFILIIPNIYGIIRVNEFDHDKLLKDNKTLKIGLIQPDINPWRKWEHDPVKQIDLHFRIQDSLINASGPVDIAIWSETAVTNVSYNFNFGHDFSYLLNRLKRTKTSLLTGFVDFYIFKNDEEIPTTAKLYNENPLSYYSSYNSALLLQPSGDTSYPPQIYHKMKLTPFSEKMPFIDILSFAKKWFEWGVGISSWTPGSTEKNLILHTGSDSVAIAPIICIESIYPYFVRDFVNKGAGVLVVITNDGWFDHTPGPEQHYLIAAMRAIENRRYLARAANTGITGFIKPTGETLKKAPQYQQTGIEAKIPILHNISIFYYFGDYLPILSVVLLAIIIIFIFFDKRKLIL